MIPKELTANKNIYVERAMIPDVFQTFDYSLGISYIYTAFNWFQSPDAPEYGPFEFDQSSSCTIYPQYFGGF